MPAMNGSPELEESSAIGLLTRRRHPPRQVPSQAASEAATVSPESVYRCRSETRPRRPFPILELSANSDLRHPDTQRHRELRLRLVKPQALPYQYGKVKPGWLGVARCERPTQAQERGRNRVYARSRTKAQLPVDAERGPFSR